MQQSEFLDQDELYQLTGCKRPSDQRQWLDDYGWVYAVNAAQRPVVGRLYARHKLGHYSGSPTVAPLDWRPNFSGLENTS